jgi:hypothetical protein
VGAKKIRPIFKSTGGGGQKNQASVLIFVGGRKELSWQAAYVWCSGGGQKNQQVFERLQKESSAAALQTL